MYSSKNLIEDLSNKERNYRLNLARALSNVRADITPDCWLGRSKHDLGLVFDCIVFANCPNTVRASHLTNYGLVETDRSLNSEGRSRFWFITYKVIYKNDESFNEALSKGLL